jgi:ATP-dependent Clp protease ATP-binding subunit ClpC
MGERVLGWRRPLDRFAINARRVASVVNRIINIALYIIVALALGEMLFGLFMGAPPSFDYWLNTKNPSLLFFWFGCFCGFIILSRRRAARYEAVPVVRREYKDEATPPATPSGWEAVRAIKSNLFINVSRSYSPNAILVVENAVIAADRAGHASLEPIHLFISLLEDKEVAVLFARAGLPVAGLIDRADRAISGITEMEKHADAALSPGVQSALLGAYADSYAAREEKVEPGALLVGVSEDPTVAEILNDLGITPEILANVVAWSRINRAARRAARRYRRNASLKPSGNLDRAMTAIATPMLDRFSHDLTRAARWGRLPFLVDREAELAAVFRAIEGGRTSVALVGEPGVGKDAIVYGIAERMVEEDVPKPLQDKRLISLSISDLIAGAAPEEVDGRLMQALNEVARSKNIVLVIDNVDALADVTGIGVDLSEVFATELSRGYFYCIATAYPSRYKKLENHPLGHALERIDVREPEQNAAIRILMSVVGAIEYDQNVFFTYQAIERSVVLSTRYLHDRFLPEKAIEILKEAAQYCRREKGEKSLVTGEDVAVIVSEKSHVPVTAVTESERGKLLSMEKDLHARVIGQDEAVSAVSAALRRARAELRAKNRPISAFLFLGPTGVGKTELAKTVAAVYFGAESNMIRLDMSEYQESSAVHRLIGVPGQTGGGLLTEAIRKEPFALLLLDEFEKAHPDILNIFLQVMDDGRLTDNEGRTVDFTNCIIVATSNAGSQYIQDSMRAGASVDEVKKGLLNTQLKGIFKPELLNRFDGVIVFKPLTKDEIEQVAWLMMGAITDELAGRGITFRATDEAVAELATIGFDPVFGARPMRRAIQEKVENALADALLKEKIERRDTVVLEPGGVINIEKGKKL